MCLNTEVEQHNVTEVYVHKYRDMRNARTNDNTSIKQMSLSRKFNIPARSGIGIMSMPHWSSVTWKIASACGWPGYI